MLLILSYSSYALNYKISHIHKSEKSEEESLNIVVMGDGFIKSEVDDCGENECRYQKLVKSYFLDSLLSMSPWKENAYRINIYRFDIISKDKGINNPLLSEELNTALDSSFFAGGVPRAIAPKMRSWGKIDEIASQVPKDIIVVIMNVPVHGGGASRRDLISITTHPLARYYTLPHEMAHALADIADEYEYLLHPKEIEKLPMSIVNNMEKFRMEVISSNPTEANIDIDPINPKWRNLINRNVELPTPTPLQVPLTLKKQECFIDDEGSYLFTSKDQFIEFELDLKDESTLLTLLYTEIPRDQILLTFNDEIIDTNVNDSIFKKIVLKNKKLGINILRFSVPNGIIARGFIRIYNRGFGIYSSKYDLDEIGSYKGGKYDKEKFYRPTFRSMMNFGGDYSKIHLDSLNAAFDNLSETKLKLKNNQ